MSLDLWSMRQRSWHCWLQRKLRQDWPYKPSVSTHGPSIKSKTQKHVFKTHDMHIQVITCIWNFKKVSLLRIQLVLEISCTTYASNWVNPKTFQNINRRSKLDKTLLAWIYTKKKTSNFKCILRIGIITCGFSMNFQICVSEMNMNVKVLF